MATMYCLRPTELRNQRRSQILQEIHAINTACLDAARRLALRDLDQAAMALHISREEADAIATMPDGLRDNFASAGICVLHIERYPRMPAEPASSVIDIIAELQDLSRLTIQAAHRLSNETIGLCETVFRMSHKDVRALADASVLELAGLGLSCSLRINGLTTIVDLANRERLMPQTMAKPINIGIAARMAMLLAGVA